MSHQTHKRQVEDLHKRFGSHKLLKGASQTDQGRIGVQGRPAEVLESPRTERLVKVFSGRMK